VRDAHEQRKRQLKKGRAQTVVGRPGLDRGERQPFVTGAAGRMVGGGVRPPAGSDTTQRAKRASNALTS